MVKWENEHSLPVQFGLRLTGVGMNEIFDLEVMGFRVDLRASRICIDGLKTNPEFTDFRQVGLLAAMGYGANAFYVRIVKGSAIVPKFKTIVEERKCNFTSAGVLRILQ